MPAVTSPAPDRDGRAAGRGAQTPYRLRTDVARPAGAVTVPLDDGRE